MIATFYVGDASKKMQPFRDGIVLTIGVVAFPAARDGDDP
jgi:hypothetical protein